MTDTDRMVVWLRETLDAAQADAEAAHAVDPAPWTADVTEQGAPERFWPGRSDTGAGMVKDAKGDDLWDCEGSETLCMTGASARHAARHDPAAVLRRLTADRKTLDEHAENPYDPGYCRTCTVHEDGWAVPVPAELPCATIRNLAEGWGWEEDQQ